MRKSRIESIVAIIALLGVLLLFGAFMLGNATAVLAVVASGISLVVVAVTVGSQRLNKQKESFNKVLIVAVCSVVCAVLCGSFIVHVNAQLSFEDKMIGNLLTVTASARGDTDSSKPDSGSPSKVTISNDVITIEAKGYTNCNNKADYDEVTVTVTNKNDRTVSFTLAYDANVTTSQASGYGELASKGTITFKVKTDKGANKTGKITFTNVALVEDDVDTETVFDVRSGGTYTVLGEGETEPTTVASQITKTQSCKDLYTLVAYPNSGYVFYGWMSSTYGLLSQSSTYSYDASQGVKDTVWPVFTVEGGAIYYIKNESPRIFYGDLTEALTKAKTGSKKEVMLYQSGILPAGDYTIPSGVTLLIPFNDAGTLYTSSPGFVQDGEKFIDSADYQTIKSYRTLVMATGANITVNGALSVSAKLQEAISGCYQGGTAREGYGLIKMCSGSNITVDSGGALCVWGYISANSVAKGDNNEYIKDEGSVVIKSGATVYESFQICDYRGADDSANMEHDVFPFSQYYIQNVEVPMTIHHGATEICPFSTRTSVGSVGSQVKFIGNENSESLFRIKSGFLIKDYKEETDRLEFSVKGEMTISSVSIELAGGSGMTGMLNTSINSSNYILPLNGNITIDIITGSLTVSNQAVALLPGAEVYIREGAKAVINSHLYVYSAAVWPDGTGSNSFCGPLGQAICQAGKLADFPGELGIARTITNAKIVFAGEAEINKGLYTTAVLENGAVKEGSVADVICTGTGTIKLNVQEGKTVTWQLNDNQSKNTYVEIPVTAIKVKDQNGNAIATLNDAGKQYTFSKDAENNVVVTISCAHLTTETVSGTAATCTQTGLTEGVKCNTCGEVVTAQEEIPMKDHFDQTGDKDHKCDTCPEIVTDCVDDIKDHKCDECEAGFNENLHVDVNPKDHICDYGCTTPIGEHTDEGNKDHQCDYYEGCKVVVGTHADGNDNDHLCDYCKGEVEGEACVDTKLPKDHKCDECGADMDIPHADGDNDKDHVCDHCGGTVADEVCVDNNKDHKCDECQKTCSD